MKKILLIIFDKDKELSKKFASINKFFINYNDKNNKEIINGKYKKFYKIFAVSDHNMIQDIGAKYKIVIINNNPNFNNNINIEHYIDPSEFIDKYIQQDYSFYSNREITTISKLINEIKDQNKINLTVILAGKINKTTMITYLKNTIDELKNNFLINNKSMIKKIKFIYTGYPNEFLINFLSIDEHVEISENDITNSKSNINMLSNGPYYNIIDNEKYIYYWASIYKYAKNQKIIMDNPNDIYCICEINTFNNKINVLNLIEKIMQTPEYSEFESKPITQCHQHIFAESDIFALGTRDIMLYYMLLYKYYGFYKFKDNIRTLPTNCIITSDEYNKETDKMTLESRYQLFEHIMHFTDSRLTKIHNKDEITINYDKPKIDIIFVTYYGFREQLIDVKNSLEKIGYNCHNYSYNANFNDHGNDYMMQKLEELINSVKPTYILWWILNIKTENLDHLSKKYSFYKNIYYNWDDPYNWLITNINDKAKYLDYAFITCQDSVTKYKEHGTKKAYCIYPGYSPVIHKPIPDTEYEYDICFICTNLYENLTMYPDQIVSRKEIVETLYDNQEKCEYKFAIYGPENLKNRFPLSYKGFCKYTDTCNIINKSKINLCTHVVGNKSGYLNERIFLILACGGLLFVDPVPGVESILENGKNCIFINKTRYLNQITDILKNYDKYKSVKENAYQKSLQYTWDDWALRIHEKLIE